MSSNSRRKILLFLGIAGFFIFAALTLVYYSSDIAAYARAVKVLNTLSTLEDKDYQTYFAQHIGDINRLKDINGMVELVLKDFEEGRITMFECHSLGHDLGHYGGYEDNFLHVEEYLSKRNLDFCGSGFLHGVEGQLANNPYPQNAEYLYTFCKYAMPLEPFYKGCYHGAGHAFMENTRDPLVALKECDLLITDEELVSDVSNCYRGVFSEHSDYMHEEGKSKAEVLGFCMELPAEFHAYCAEELNGLHITPTSDISEMNEAFHLCAEGGYSDVITFGCAHSVAGVVADSLLGRGEEVIMPAWAFSFNEVAQRGMIDGTVGALRKNGTKEALSNLESFCESMDTNEKEAYCLAASKF